jgi:excisionase family DNA binding protein
MDEGFMTVFEVAELLRVNPQTVRNWIDKGSLPAARVGRRVRIRRSDLDRILHTGTPDVEPDRASNQSDADIEPVAETTDASAARDGFAGALADTFRVAAGLTPA